MNNNPHPDFLLPHLHPNSRLLSISADKIQSLQSDAPSIPFPDNSFDITYASHTLQYAANPTAVLREMARITTPGGIIAARDADYGAMTWHPLHPGLSRWRAVFSVVSDLTGSQPNAGRHLPTWFLEADLKDTTVSSSNSTYATGEEKEALASSWIQHTHEESYQKRIKEVLGEETVSATKQITTGWNEWKNTPGAVMVLPHLEVIAQI